MLKPILLSIIFGALLAYILNPLYKRAQRIVSNKNIAAALVVIFTLLLIILPVIFITPIVLRQSFELYQASQQIDLLTPLKKLFPAVFASEYFTAQFSGTLNSFIRKITTSFMQNLTDIILNLPIVFLHIFIVLFTFYFVMRDQDKIFSYFHSISPFPQETEKQLISHSKSIADAVVYGQVLIGILQGILTGVALFIFQIPHALLLTFIAVIASIIPILGPFLIWVPADIYLFVKGETASAIGLLIVGIFISTIDNILRPLFVAKRTKIPSSIIFLGMIGGFFLFGILGFVIGPLILAYLLIVLEIFRNKDIKDQLFQEENKK
jgi:predicted PurR-regulated permease PerM